MEKNYPMLSSDGHLEVLPERWTGRMPEKYRKLAPHTTILPDGSDAIVMERHQAIQGQLHRFARG